MCNCQVLPLLLASKTAPKMCPHQRKKTRFSLVFFLWWSDGDSNPGPPACKAGALAN